MRKTARFVKSQRQRARAPVGMVSLVCSSSGFEVNRIAEPAPPPPADALPPVPGPLQRRGAPHHVPGAPPFVEGVPRRCDGVVYLPTARRLPQLKLLVVGVADRRDPEAGRDRDEPPRPRIEPGLQLREQALPAAPAAYSPRP